MSHVAGVIVTVAVTVTAGPPRPGRGRPVNSIVITDC